MMAIAMSRLAWTRRLSFFFFLAVMFPCAVCSLEAWVSKGCFKGVVAIVIARAQGRGKQGGSREEGTTWEQVRLFDLVASILYSLTSSVTRAMDSVKTSSQPVYSRWSYRYTRTTSAEQLGFYLVRKEASLSPVSLSLIMSTWEIFLIVVRFHGVSDGFCALITMRFSGWGVCLICVHLSIDDELSLPYDLEVWDHHKTIVTATVIIWYSTRDERYNAMTSVLW